MCILSLFSPLAECAPAFFSPSRPVPSHKIRPFMQVTGNYSNSLHRNLRTRFYGANFRLAQMRSLISPPHCLILYSPSSSTQFNLRSPFETQSQQLLTHGMLLMVSFGHAQRHCFVLYCHGVSIYSRPREPLMYIAR